jgi:hypothetical protein
MEFNMDETTSITIVSLTTSFTSIHLFIQFDRDYKLQKVQLVLMNFLLWFYPHTITIFWIADYDDNASKNMISKIMESNVAKNKMLVW